MLGRCKEDLYFGDAGVFGDARKKKHVWRKGRGAREGNWLGWSHLCYAFLFRTLQRKILTGLEHIGVNATWSSGKPSLKYLAILQPWAIRHYEPVHTTVIRFIKKKKKLKKGSFSVCVWGFFVLFCFVFPYLWDIQSWIVFSRFLLQMWTVRNNLLNYLFLTEDWYSCSTPPPLPARLLFTIPVNIMTSRFAFNFPGNHSSFLNTELGAFVLLCGFAPTCPSCLSCVQLTSYCLHYFKD